MNGKGRLLHLRTRSSESTGGAKMRNGSTWLFVLSAAVGLAASVGGLGLTQDGGWWSEEAAAPFDLNMVVLGFEARGEQLDSVLGRLQEGEPGFVICVEWQIGRDPSTCTPRSVTVGPFERATVRQILDAVTAAAEPGNFYTWYESKLKPGVVHILPLDPKERYACLDVVIPRFRVENVMTFQALFALFQQPEVGGIRPGLSGTGPEYGGITLDLTNVTVRDALTHICLATKSGMGWIVTGYVQDPPVPGLCFGRFGSAIRQPEELRREILGAR